METEREGGQGQGRAIERRKRRAGKRVEREGKGALVPASQLYGVRYTSHR